MAKNYNCETLKMLHDEGVITGTERLNLAILKVRMAGTSYVQRTIAEFLSSQRLPNDMQNEIKHNGTLFTCCHLIRYASCKSAYNRVLVEYEYEDIMDEYRECSHEYYLYRDDAWSVAKGRIGYIDKPYFIKECYNLDEITRMANQLLESGNKYDDRHAINIARFINEMLEYLEDYEMLSPEETNDSFSEPYEHLLKTKLIHRRSCFRRKADRDDYALEKPGINYDKIYKRNSGIPFWVLESTGTEPICAETICRSGGTYRRNSRRGRGRGR